MRLRLPPRPRPGVPPPAPRRVAWLAAAAAVLTAGNSCYVSVGSDLDDPPHCSLSVDPERAAPGAPLRLSASASDDSGIERVRFFRSGASGSVDLGSDAEAPYRLVTTMPGNAVGTVEFFARVTDTDGQSRESDRVTVDVLD